MHTAMADPPPRRQNPWSPDPMDKTGLRREMRRRRRMAAAIGARAAAQALARRLFPLLSKGNGRLVLAGYVATGSEIDPALLLARLAGAGATLVLPGIEDDAEGLVFRRWTPADPLVPGRFGILEPARDMPAIDPDILLVPGLAFDCEGRRLGQGGGHYDRTLRVLRAKRPLLAIGLAFGAQLCERLPEEPHDERLDLVATPEALYDPSGTARERLERL